MIIYMIDEEAMTTTTKEVIGGGDGYPSIIRLGSWDSSHEKKVKFNIIIENTMAFFF